MHGLSKTGKSTFADTAPKPLLVLDAEAGFGTKFTTSRKVHWDPMLDGPPAADGTWETCVVYVRDFNTVKRVYDWLNSGQHPFSSVSLDSISEIQQRCIDAIAGSEAMRTQDWGELFRKINALIRQFRDLAIHPTKPVECIIFVAMTKETDGVYRPYVQGSAATTMPYYVDIVAYLYAIDDGTGNMQRHILCTPHSQFTAGDRTGRLGGFTQPSIPAMLDTIFGPQQQ